MNRLSVCFAALFCVVGFAACGVTPALADDKGAIEKELKNFAGAWTVERVEAGEMEIPIDLFKEMKVTFEGDKYTVKMGDMVIQNATMKVDPAKTPKTMDGTIAEGANKGSMIVGIYELSGDTLKICFDPEGKKRPTEFKTAAGAQTTLAVYKRVKK